MSMAPDEVRERTSVSEHGGTDARDGERPRRRFDFAVVACIVVLAVLLGVLNNLRVASERKVGWFDVPEDRDDSAAAKEAMP